MNIGNIIRKARRQKDITQKKLASILGVSPMVVFYWEKNMSFPSGNLLLLLMKELNLNKEELLQEEKPVKVNQG